MIIIQMSHQIFILHKIHGSNMKFVIKSTWTWKDFYREIQTMNPILNRSNQSHTEWIVWLRNCNRGHIELSLWWLVRFSDSKQVGKPDYVSTRFRTHYCRDIPYLTLWQRNCQVWHFKGNFTRIVKKLRKEEFQFCKKNVHRKGSHRS